MWHHGSWLSKASLCGSEIVQHLVTWKFTMIGIKSQQISYSPEDGVFDAVDRSVVDLEK